MRSFTSTFRRKNRWKKTVLGLTSFGVTLLVCVTAAEWLAAVHPRWATRDPVGREAWKYRSTTVFETLDHPYTDYAFYHGIGPSMANARKADVLIVGNSLSMDAFTEEAVQEAGRKSGLAFFNLSLPGSNYAFERAVILRQNLRPKWIILNDVGFFGTRLRREEKETLDLTDWQCWMRIQQHSLYWAFQYALQRWFPKLQFFKMHSGETFYLLRSAKDGCVLEETVAESGPPKAFRPREATASAQQMELAVDFEREMEKRGARILLVHIPSPVASSYTVKLAKDLGLPFVAPDSKGMRSYDGLHLSMESSAVFSRRFFRQLFKFAGFRELIRDKKKMMSTGARKPGSRVELAREPGCLPQ